MLGKILTGKGASGRLILQCARLKESGRVAQVVEQCPFKAWVAGSNPAALTKLSTKRATFAEGLLATVAHRKISGSHTARSRSCERPGSGYGVAAERALQRKLICPVGIGCS